MPRLSPRLLVLLGVLLVALRIGVPLSSSPPQDAATTRSVVEAPELPMAPELEDINREVDRLRDRLAEPGRAIAPARDPFQFANRGDDRVVDARRFIDNAPADPERRAPAMVWPTLVAILSSGSDASPARRVVIEDAAGIVHVRSIGEAHGDITISAIGADHVTLVHAPSGASTRLVLH